MIERGHEYHRVLAMDLLSFESLYDSCDRLQAAQRGELLYLYQVSAHGEKKHMNEWLDHNMPDSIKASNPSNDLNKFLSLHGKGI